MEIKWKELLLMIPFCVVSAALLISSFFSAGVTSFVSYSFILDPFPEAYGPKIRNLGYTSSVFAFISLILIYIAVMQIKPFFYLVGSTVLQLIAIFINFYLASFLHPSRMDSQIQYFMDNYHNWESMKTWSETVGYCINLTTDESCGNHFLGYICCDAQIAGSLANRFQKPYPYLITLSSIWIVCLIAIFPISYYTLYVPSQKKKDQ